jgi:hypothetical protein
MIKKFAQLLGRKLFIPKSEREETKVETQTSLLQKKAMFQKTTEPSPGIPAPVETPVDPWFNSVPAESIKTDKQRQYEQQLAQERLHNDIRNEKKKEPNDIHQKMYEIATKNWTTVAETQGGSENFQEGPGGWNSGNGMGQFKS